MTPVGDISNALIEVGDDRGDRPPKRSPSQHAQEVLISLPGSNSSLDVIPLENFSGDPDLARKMPTS